MDESLAHLEHLPPQENDFNSSIISLDPVIAEETGQSISTLAAEVSPDQITVSVPSTLDFFVPDGQHVANSSIDIIHIDFRPKDADLISQYDGRAEKPESTEAAEPYVDAPAATEQVPLNSNADSEQANGIAVDDMILGITYWPDDDFLATASLPMAEHTAFAELANDASTSANASIRSIGNDILIEFHPTHVRKPDPCEKFVPLLANGLPATKLTDLSDDVLRHILSFTVKRTRLYYSETNRQMYFAACSNDTWQQFVSLKSHDSILRSINHRLNRKYSKLVEVESRGTQIKKISAEKERAERLQKKQAEASLRLNLENHTDLMPSSDLRAALFMLPLLIFAIVCHISAIVSGLVLDNTIPNQNYWWFLFAYLPWLVFVVVFIACFVFNVWSQRYFPFLLRAQYTGTQEVYIPTLIQYVWTWLPLLVLCVGFKLIAFRYLKSWCWIMLPMSIYMVHIAITGLPSTLYVVNKYLGPGSSIITAVRYIAFLVCLCFHFTSSWVAMLLSFLMLDEIIPTRVTVPLGKGFAPVIVLCIPHLVSALSFLLLFYMVVPLLGKSKIAKALVAFYSSVIVLVGFVATTVLVALAADGFFPSFFFAFFPLLGIGWIQLILSPIAIAICLLLLLAFSCYMCVRGVSRGEHCCGWIRDIIDSYDD